MLIEVYVDDIIFGSDDNSFSQEISRNMEKEFDMSLLREINFSLGTQIFQLNEHTFLSQSKYITEILKKFQMEECKPINTLTITKCKVTKEDESK